MASSRLPRYRRDGIPAPIAGSAGDLPVERCLFQDRFATLRIPVG